RTGVGKRAGRRPLLPDDRAARGSDVRRALLTVLKSGYRNPTRTRPHNSVFRTKAAGTALALRIPHRGGQNDALDYCSPDGRTRVRVRDRASQAQGTGEVRATVVPSASSRSPARGAHRSARPPLRPRLR